jgi:hypothetical protein
MNSENLKIAVSIGGVLLAGYVTYKAYGVVKNVKSKAINALSYIISKETSESVVNTIVDSAVATAIVVKEFPLLAYPISLVTKSILAVGYYLGNYFIFYMIVPSIGVLLIGKHIKLKYDIMFSDEITNALTLPNLTDEEMEDMLHFKSEIDNDVVR